MLTVFLAARVVLAETAPTAGKAKPEILVVTARPELKVLEAWTVDQGREELPALMV